MKFGSFGLQSAALFKDALTHHEGPEVPISRVNTDIVELLFHIKSLKWSDGVKDLKGVESQNR